jgi:16S rRNA (cytosine1402-N4)-methyltransferase
MVTPVAAAQASGLGTFSNLAIRKLLGTALVESAQPVVCTAPGWLSARRPFPLSLAGRMKSLGTELHSLIEPLRSAAPGWLSARASVDFSQKKQNHELGTVSGYGKSDVESAAGWLSASASESFSPKGYHLPVMPNEVIEMMEAGPGKFIIDGTLGGGGHSELLLKTGAKVLGVDRDPEALAHAGERLAAFGAQFSTFQANFSEIPTYEGIAAGELADGLLLDLGVSSRQLDAAERGFSFMREGPLDMRMGPNATMTAAELVNTWPEAEITRILFSYGEEPRSRRIASAIVSQREKKPFETTLELAACIENAVGRNSKIHPATRSFQAIRMAINEELESLASILESAEKVLKPGGRLLIITFHSLEDRMVKRFLRHHSQPYIDDPTWPAPRPNPDFKFRLISKKAIAPSQTETSSNPRARSAKLRVAQLSGPEIVTSNISKP